MVQRTFVNHQSMSGTLPTAFQISEEELKHQLETEIAILRGRCAAAKHYLETNRKDYSSSVESSDSVGKSYSSSFKSSDSSRRSYNNSIKLPDSVKTSLPKKSSQLHIFQKRKPWEKPTVICHKRTPDLSSQRRSRYPAADYIQIKLEPRPANIAEEVTAVDAAKMETEIQCHLQENMMKVKEERDAKARARFRAALEKKQLEDEYSRILKLLEEAQRAYRLEQSKTYKPQESISKCEPVDKIIKKDFQSALEGQVEKIFKSVKEHAIEDLEGYNDEFEKRYGRDTEKEGSLRYEEDIAFDSLLAKDNFEERYFLNREKDMDEDIFNTAYVDSPPSIDKSDFDASETKTPTGEHTVDEPSDKSYEKRNAAVQAESPVLVESKGVQADVKLTKRDLKEKESSRGSKMEGAFHTPRKCFDVVRDTLFGKEFDASTDTSGSTIYHPLPPGHGIPIFPSLYQPNAEEGSLPPEDACVAVTGHVEVDQQRSDSSVVSSEGKATSEPFEAEESTNSSRLLPPLTGKSTGNILSYLKHIASKYDMKDGSTKSTTALVCAIPLSEPIRKRPGDMFPHNLYGSEGAPVLSKASPSVSTTPGTDTEQSGYEDVLGVNDVPRSQRVPSLSLIANVSEDSSVNLTEGSVNVTDGESPDVSVNEKQEDVKHLQTLREFLFLQLREKFPTLLSDNSVNTSVSPSQQESEQTREDQQASQQLHSRDIPFIYHELSTIQEMDSALTAAGDDSRRSSKDMKETSKNMVEANSRYPLTSLLEDQMSDVSHLLESIQILPRKSLVKSVSVEEKQDSSGNSLPSSAMLHRPKSSLASQLQSPSDEVTSNILLRGAEDVSLNKSLVFGTLYPTVPAPADDLKKVVTSGSSQGPSKFLTSQPLCSSDESVNSDVSSSAKSSSSSSSSWQKFHQLPQKFSHGLINKEGDGISASAENHTEFSQIRSSDPSSGPSHTSCDKAEGQLSSYVFGKDKSMCSFESKSEKPSFQTLASGVRPSVHQTHSRFNRIESCKSLDIAEKDKSVSSVQSADSFSPLAEVILRKPSTSLGPSGSSDGISPTNIVQSTFPLGQIRNSASSSSPSTPRDSSSDSVFLEKHTNQHQGSKGHVIPQPFAAMKDIVEKQRVAYYGNPEVDSNSDCFSMLAIATMNMTLKRQMEGLKKGQIDKPVTDLAMHMRTARSTSSEDSLSNMFSSSKIAYHSTPVRSEVDLSGEEGISDQPEITLIGDELTLQQTVAADRYVDITDMSTHKTDVYIQKKASHLSDFRTAIPQLKSDAGNECQGQRQSSSESTPQTPVHEEKLSISMISFLRHEVSALKTPDYERVSLISSHPSSSPCSSQFDASNESTPKNSGSSSGSASSRVSVASEQKYPKRSSITNLGLSSEDYKRRTKRLWNNLAEVKAKQQMEEKKKNFILNKKKVKELQDKLHSQRKPPKRLGGKSK